MDLNNLKAQLLDLQMRLNAIVSVVVNNSPPEMPSSGTYPVTEVPPAHDACKRMWEAAMNATNPKGRLFNIFAFVGQGLVQGATPGAAPRMSQETQDALEAAIVALGHSEWGQSWLSHDENASMIDHRYCYKFVGYYVTPAHPHNPDLGFVRTHSAP
jgi:hypothetical protein